nr:MAG TPA: hypothetical protein [Caudoviricetes sp.]
MPLFSPPSNALYFISSNLTLFSISRFILSIKNTFSVSVRFNKYSRE